MRIILILSVILCFVVSAARADEWGQVVKVDCVAEMNFFDLRSYNMALTSLDDKLFSRPANDRLWKNHGIIFSPTDKPQDYSCKLANGAQVVAQIKIDSAPLSCGGNSHPTGFLKLWYKEKDYSVLFYDGVLIDNCSYEGASQLSAINVHSDSIFLESGQKSKQFWIYDLKKGKYKNELPANIKGN